MEPIYPTIVVSYERQSHCSNTFVFLRNLLYLPMLAHIVMRLLEAISPLSLLVSPIYHPIIYL